MHVGRHRVRAEAGDDHLVGSGDLIVMDELVHSSAVHGIKATRATVRSFRHSPFRIPYSFYFFASSASIAAITSAAIG